MRDDALSRLRKAVDLYAQEKDWVRIRGVVTEAFPSHFRVEGLSPFLRLDDCVMLEGHDRCFPAQAIRINRDGALIKAFESHAGVGLGARVTRTGPFEIAPHPDWKGRVLNAFAAPIDGREPPPPGEARRAVDASPPKAMSRGRVRDPAPTGVRVVDAFTPLCRGQRVGVFAGSGVGKSTLLAMMSRSAAFDAVVVCLVGERGREVRDFLDEILGDRSNLAITIVATGDESPMMRRLAPLTATSIAEYFRDRGESVLLIMDSVTRYAHALREIALSAGEPPVANGFAPSVFADLPRLLERAGPGVEGGGAITAIFSVLIDGDNHNDPIADCIRGTLDGHIVLEREIAEQGRYPAINVLKSISRLADRVWSGEQRDLINECRALISKYEDTRDLRMLGGYQPGADAALDRAIELAPRLYEALKQSPHGEPSIDAIGEIASVVGLRPASH
ncbi:flagellar protein export ATPase FliI [Methylocystis sp. WRRC1]|uniref:FliI/YscN family ATPase n=1 Tax=Methylocystis sp. WRRC1 TaxID=1732014 RepID=UPI001D14814E|nr:FliI/YscN family ATPase [Methylocystis sp. WRRC1]MCC3245290.1 flagellar protein export ATPase FliI [Methylocystis sp. WRRC1]